MEAQNGPTLIEFSLVCGMRLSCESCAAKQHCLKKITHRRHMHKNRERASSAWQCGAVACVEDMSKMCFLRKTLMRTEALSDGDVQQFREQWRIYFSIFIVSS